MSRPLVTAAQDAAARYGVNFHETDIGRDGGKIVIVGGAPVLNGNDAERVLRAVHDVVGAHPSSSPIGLRAGVNAGRVFVFSHDFRLARRRIFSVTGDAVNLAARVMGHAGPGQVLATQTVLVRAGNPFVTEAVTPFKVKGKSEAVVAFALGAPRQSVAEAAGDLPFVGREAELGALLDRAAQAANGSGSVVEITGEPGIGKSRLVSEALDRWRLELSPGDVRGVREHYPLSGLPPRLPQAARAGGQYSQRSRRLRAAKNGGRTHPGAGTVHTSARRRGRCPSSFDPRSR